MTYDLYFSYFDLSFENIIHRNRIVTIMEQIFCRAVILEKNVAQANILCHENIFVEFFKLLFKQIYTLLPF